MNRLVLIGNGFDLNHNLKTHYSDFLNWYLGGCMERFFTNRIYEDCLLKLENLGHSFNMGVPFMDTLEQTIIAYKNLINNSRNSNLKIEFRSQFFNEVFDRASINTKWVDFENHYFSYLKKYSEQIRYDEIHIKSYNAQFEFIKLKFEEYLREVTNKRITQDPDKFNFLEIPFVKNEFTETPNGIGKKPDNIYILNFNYTNTFNIYAEKLKENIPTQIKHIHGELGNDKNPIIFGFGDEHDKDYVSFEDKKVNELFKHIKSFQYLKTSNYQDLIRFINSDDYQVCILGHSCGLSDRTMLKEIFEHNKCKSIKIYYYKWGNESHENDYVEKTYEISRHFTDKGMMRKKVVSFDKSEPLR